MLDACVVCNVWDKKSDGHFKLSNNYMYIQITSFVQRILRQLDMYTRRLHAINVVFLNIQRSMIDVTNATNNWRKQRFYYYAQPRRPPTPTNKRSGANNLKMWIQVAAYNNTMTMRWTNFERWDARAPKASAMPFYRTASLLILHPDKFSFNFITLACTDKICVR